MNNDPAETATGQPKCPFCAFGLIVTGEGEREFLPDLFTSLMQRAGCSFTVLTQIGQRSPITAGARKMKMVGSGMVIPTSDEEKIGLPARRFLRGQPCHFVILIDDAEAARRPILDKVFHRYRIALDTMLLPEERSRAAVHFLANMVESYYFAHSQAVNNALGAQVLNGDYSGDVEEIGHPKNDLKQRHPSFDEKADGEEIAANLDLNHILNDPKACAFLRALFAWCVRQLMAHCPVYDANLSTYYQILVGVQSPLTRNQ